MFLGRCPGLVITRGAAIGPSLTANTGLTVRANAERIGDRFRKRQAN